MSTPETPVIALETSRRSFLKTCAAGAGMVSASAIGTLIPAGVKSSAYARGPGAPEKTILKDGFIPLTDCASVVVAATQNLGKKYGLTIVPSKEASWAGVRDKLVNGELDAAHVLYGLIYGVQMGIGGQQKDMSVLMTLNQNGQGITLSNQLRDQKKVTDGTSLKKLITTEPREYTFAQTFPTGTHAMWLYYWLASIGVNPMKDVKTIVVPPPQMVANMRIGNMDGYCVGEPWNARAVADNAGRSLAEIYSGAEFTARIAAADPLTGPGLPALAEAAAAGRPVILAVAHFGNFDAIRAALVARGWPIGALYRPMHNTASNAHYVAAMQAIARPLFPRSRSGMMAMLRFLKAGGVLALAFDQHKGDGALLRFFGLPTRTVLTPAELALRFDALLVPIISIRQPDGLGFRVEVGLPIPHSTPEAMMQALNDDLEGQVRAHMGQWFWVHRGWK